MEFVAKYYDWLLIAGGLVGLFLGGEALVRGSVAVADRLRLPKLLVGLTIVGFGTSMPELMVSLKAVQSGAPDVAVGNVIGSNIANILLILGLGALIRPLSTRARGIRRDTTVMVLVTLGLGYFGWRGGITQIEGAAMAGILLVYVLCVFVIDRKAVLPAPEASKPLAAPVALTFIAIGLGALIFGADALVRGATTIATEFGVSQAVIGLTLVAVGTSLPELTVSVISAIKGQNELAIGNVVGSNIFNVLAVLGITAAIAPVSIDPLFLKVDVPLVVGAALLFWVLMLAKPKLGRMSALGSLATYGAYVAWLIAGSAPGS
ncbi:MULTISPECIES: calcium/sodium antiporter [Asticcacaulis]|uniref:calcium/sodium antiporter n=1 Tax=Asticcacaulis TaxID=76890 RepID=UPI001AE5573C|nr:MULTISPECIES: calcium/sodium antiporter [Asticcacaulis]MBP2160458.1 cation:H+ antiporter [Asticcacaulis solisilvae]MDR6801503.1 cation:H+ antiporter [Asticcacaulis sp. BE141]